MGGVFRLQQTGQQIFDRDRGGSGVSRPAQRSLGRGRVCHSVIGLCDEREGTKLGVGQEAVLAPGHRNEEGLRRGPFRFAPGNRNHQQHHEPGN